MTKNDIQRLSLDQLSQGQEGIPPLVQTSGTCGAQKRTRSGRIIGTSPIKEANRTPPNVQVDVAHTSLKKLHNDSRRVDTFLPMQDIENGDDTPIPPPTLQDCGTPRNVNKNSTPRRMTRSHSRIVGIDELMRGFGNVEDTIAPAIMDTSETPFDPNNNTSTMDADSTTSYRRQNGCKIEITKQVPQAFQEVPNNSFGKANPYKHVSDQKRLGIGYVIDLPRENSRHDTPTSARQIELFKLMHWNSQNGWINQEVEASYEKMLELQKQRVRKWSSLERS
ncbi:hypothetical protein AAG906_038191 [Vitis piasezkii]